MNADDFWIDYDDDDFDFELAMIRFDEYVCNNVDKTDEEYARNHEYDECLKETF